MDVESLISGFHKDMPNKCPNSADYGIRLKGFSSFAGRVQLFLKTNITESPFTRSFTSGLVDIDFALSAGKFEYVSIRSGGIPESLTLNKIELYCLNND